MEFKLQSKNKPTGDQPRAIKKLVSGVLAGAKRQTLLGVTGSGKTFTMANIIAKVQRPTLVVVHNKTLAAQLATEFSELFPQSAVGYFVSYYDYYQPESYIPRTDTYIAKDADINEEVDRLRHKATVSLLTRRDVIVVASVSCIYGLGSPKNYNIRHIEIKKGQYVKRDELLKQLIAIQFARNDIDFKRSTFRVRGDIVEIFPSYGEEIIRVEFFGDKIERIREINEITGEIMGELKDFQIFPASHYLSGSEDALKKALPSIKEELDGQLKYFNEHHKLTEAERLEQRVTYDLEMMREMGFVSGIENYSRYLDGRKPGAAPYTLLDYFPKDYLMFIDESHMTVPQIGGMSAGDRSRKETLVEYGFRLPSAFDNRPLNFKEFERRINQVIFVSATPKPYELESSTQVVEQLIRPTGLLDPTVEVRPISNQVDDLLAEIKIRVAKNQRVLVTTLTKKMSEELSEYLKELGLKVAYLHADVDNMERLEILQDLRKGIYDVLVGINLLREGLDLPEVSLVAILDADKEGFLRNVTSLVQTMGRAARHKQGHAIMYADRLTDSMRKAINETTRRRQLQELYNKKHGIEPTGIVKAIGKTRLAGARKEIPDTKSNELRLDKKALQRVLHELQQRMEIAARNLEFEKAAALRDQIKALRKK